MRPQSSVRTARPPAGLRRAAFAVLLVALLPGVPSAAPQKAAGGIRFTYTEPNATSVSWAGEFNGWSTTANPMTRDAAGVWSVVLALPAGEHPYKFVVDGQWVADPENPVTAGDYGNSVVRVGADGALQSAAATASTPYSTRILMGGRIIGLFQDVWSDPDGRFELKRPNMDIDLGFDIKVSEVLKTRFLMNLNSEKENVQDYRTRLNFVRGSLTFEKNRLQIVAYDNEASGTWDDPLHLVGNVGIFAHQYGFNRQGVRLVSRHGGFETKAHYAVDYNPAGISYPGFIANGDSVATAQLPTIPDGPGWQLAPGGVARVTGFSLGDDNMLAFRTRRQILPGLRAGVLGRMNRGGQFGALALARATSGTGIRTLTGRFIEEWYGAGGELAWQGSHGLQAFAEFLYGKRRYTMVNRDAVPQYRDWDLASADSSGPVGSQYFVSAADALGEHVDVDRGPRLLLGAQWSESHGDIVVRGSVEHQSHRYPQTYPEITNGMTVWSLQWDRNWRYYLNREVRTGLRVEYTDFEYDPATPWDQQLWFPNGNYWLDRDEHRVGVSRLAMLGGENVLEVRPSLEVPLWQRRKLILRYRGDYASTGLDRRPKYAESIFQLGVDVTPALRFGTDSRWVKYDDAFLGLDRGYLDHWGEFTYTFAPDITVSLGAGVDPWVIDPPVREYAYIGRDLYLFDHGANGHQARTDYYGLGPAIAAAERALQAERRIQLKAVVRF